MACYAPLTFFFFFNDPATTEIYPLSLHDALPIYIFADAIRDDWKTAPERILRAVAIEPQMKEAAAKRVRRQPRTLAGLSSPGSPSNQMTSPPHAAFVRLCPPAPRQ